MLITDHIRKLSVQFSTVADLDPALKPDFSKISPEIIAAVALSAMGPWLTEIFEIEAELEMHEVSYDAASLAFILKVFEGDDPRYHLWERDDDGYYWPTSVNPAPAYGGEINRHHA